MDKKDPADFQDVFVVDTHKSVDLFEKGTVDPVYLAKSHILNDAIQEIGMGRYQVGSTVHIFMLLYSLSSNFCDQWTLFVVAGFGWFSYVLGPGAHSA